MRMPTSSWATRDLADLRMTDVDRLAGNQQHSFDARIVETFEQHALADHARGAEDDDLHDPGDDFVSNQMSFFLSTMIV